MKKPRIWLVLVLMTSTATCIVAWAKGSQWVGDWSRPDDTSASERREGDVGGSNTSDEDGNAECDIPDLAKAYMEGVEERHYGLNDEQYGAFTLFLTSELTRLKRQKDDRTLSKVEQAIADNLTPQTTIREFAIEFYKASNRFVARAPQEFLHAHPDYGNPEKLFPEHGPSKVWKVLNEAEDAAGKLEERFKALIYPEDWGQLPTDDEELTGFLEVSGKLASVLEAVLDAPQLNVPFDPDVTAPDYLGWRTTRAMTTRVRLLLLQGDRSGIDDLVTVTTFCSKLQPAPSLMGSLTQKVRTQILVEGGILEPLERGFLKEADLRRICNLLRASRVTLPDIAATELASYLQAHIHMAGHEAIGHEVSDFLATSHCVQCFKDFGATSVDEWVDGAKKAATARAQAMHALRTFVHENELDPWNHEHAERILQLEEVDREDLMPLLQSFAESCETHAWVLAAKLRLLELQNGKLVHQLEAVEEIAAEFPGLFVAFNGHVAEIGIDKYHPFLQTRMALDKKPIVTLAPLNPPLPLND